MAKDDLKALIGHSVEAEIEKVVLGGDGLARMENGTVLMVPFVITGEVVKVKIRQAKKNMLRGEVIKLESPSPERIEPGCRYFGKCGGCQYQHMVYTAQCRIKSEQIGETLSRLGKFTDEIITEILHDISPSPTEYGYRNRSILHWNGRGGYGYFATDNRTIIAVDECPVANDVINDQLTNYSQLDITPGQRELMLLGFRPEWINLAKNEINLNLLDKVFTFSPKCFLQANIPVFEDILKYVLDSVGGMSGDVLAELYCGIGILSILAADKFEKILGFDINSNNIGYARRNLERYGIKNIQFSTVDAAEALGKLIKSGVKPDTIILDPPRDGVDAGVTDGIIKLKPKNIIYISCNPATFTRDVVRLSEDYTLVSVKPFDMFPQTAHIEVVGVLSRK